jgi:hypothetical protein
MKRSLLFAALWCTSLAFAQEQLPNSSFEDIHKIQETIIYGDPSAPDAILDIEYDSLGQGWTSGNAVNRYLAIEHVFMKDTSFAHSGEHAIVMRTDSIGPVAAVGNTGLGLFVFNESNPFNSIIFGAPFTGRPVKFTGWYTYKSVAGIAPNDGNDLLAGGDSLLISCFLTKWNETNAKRDTVAFASWTSKETVQEYTNFQIVFNYFSQDAPDSANVIFLSSSLGYVADFSERPYAVKGSTLVVDDLYMDYTGAGLQDNELNALIYATEGGIHIELESKAVSNYRFYDIAGRTLGSGQLTQSGEVIPLNYRGVVYVVVENTEGSVAKRVYLN